MKTAKTSKLALVQAAVVKPVPLMCPKCGQEIQPNKLVCDCFQVEFDQERERLALERMRSMPHGFIFLTASRHLIPDRQGRALTLCRKRRFINPSIERIYRQQISERTNSQSAICQKCFDVAAKFLGREQQP